LFTISFHTCIHICIHIYYIYIYTYRCAKQENIPSTIPGPGAAAQQHTSSAVLAPASWNPEVMAVTVMPDELGINDVVFDLFGEEGGIVGEPDICNSEMVSQKMTSNKSNSPPPTGVKHMNFKELVEAMSRSYDRVNMLNMWLGSHMDVVQTLSPTDFSQIFKMFIYPESQVAVAKQLQEVRQEVTCMHIGEAAARCLDICRGDVVANLCGIRIVDIENVAAIRDNIGPLDFLSIKHLLPSS
jgi:hypothetical protein